MSALPRHGVDTGFRRAEACVACCLAADAAAEWRSEPRHRQCDAVVSEDATSTAGETSSSFLPFLLPFHLTMSLSFPFPSFLLLSTFLSTTFILSSTVFFCPATLSFLHTTYHLICFQHFLYHLTFFPTIPPHCDPDQETMHGRQGRPRTRTTPIYLGPRPARSGAADEAPRWSPPSTAARRSGLAPRGDNRRHDRVL